ncbi:MAG: Na(+)/H(+) antiporter subunit D [Caulobacterales bacterium]
MISLDQFNPGFALILAGLVCALSPWVGLRRLMLLAGPMASALLILSAGFGEHGATDALRFHLILFRLDELSFLFGLGFALAALLAGVFALHIADRLESASGLLHAGGAMAAVFAGDLVTFFLAVEVMALVGAGIVLAPRTAESARATGRYLTMQLLAGGLLAAGVALTAGAERSLDFNSLRPDSWGGGLILLALGIKCAFPGVHFWLKDSYPRASATGAVFLAPFTTKLAVYGLARAFAGADVLIWVGAIMVIFPIIYATVENDLRRVLSYSLINQLGFMVLGIGIGGPLGVGGAVALAFCHIFYKGLLFMGVGAVLHRTGTAKVTELGGLWRTMPVTALFTIIGAASIAAVPLFAGFGPKSLLTDAATGQGLWWVWFVLLVGAAGVLEHAGLKIPFFSFFAADSGKRPKEAPLNMLLAMAGSAAICIFVGVNPSWLYSLLPAPVNHDTFSVSHVLVQLQLLSFAALAFVALRRFGVHPHARDGILLDVDWFVRRPGRVLARWAMRTLSSGETALGELGRAMSTFVGPEGPIARSRLWRGGASNASAAWIAAILAVAVVAGLSTFY